MKKITIRFDAIDELAAELVTAWLESEGVTITTGGRTESVDLTYVKEA